MGVVSVVSMSYILNAMDRELDDEAPAQRKREDEVKRRNLTEARIKRDAGRR